MYPDSVTEVAEQIYSVFEEDLIKEMEYKSKEWCKPIGMEVINKFMLPKFIDGQELLLTDEEEIEVLYTKCLAELSIRSLKERGLIDLIEDENGEEVIFLTENGKKVNNTNTDD